MLASDADISKAFFAALLKACRSNCNCDVCQLLRRVADMIVQGV